MRRGTTPTHIFNTDIDLTDAQVIFITYNQRGQTVIEKEMADITVDEGQISTKLTQEETLLFDENADVEIQIAARFADNSVIRSCVICTDVQKILKDEVI